jgi:hypothetical protein
MAKDGAAEMDPADNARKFLLDSLGVDAMQRHVSAEKYHKVAADGGMQVQQGGGMPFLSNIMNKGGMAQVLFIVNNPPSQQAASILRSKVAGVTHPSGRTCINLCREIVNLRTYGKSTSSNAAGKQSINNRLNGNILAWRPTMILATILRSLLESRLVQPLQQQMKIWHNILMPWLPCFQVGRYHIVVAR